MSSSEAVEPRAARPAVSPADAPTDDVQAPAGLVSELERSRQQEDVEGFLDLEGRPAGGAGSPSYVWSTTDDA